MIASSRSLLPYTCLSICICVIWSARDIILGFNSSVTIDHISVPAVHAARSFSVQATLLITQIDLPGINLSLLPIILTGSTSSVPYTKIILIPCTIS